MGIRGSHVRTGQGRDGQLSLQGNRKLSAIPRAPATPLGRAGHVAASKGRWHTPRRSATTQVSDADSRHCAVALASARSKNRERRVLHRSDAPQDVATADRLMKDLLARSLDELPPQTRRLLTFLDEMVSGKCVQLKMERKDFHFGHDPSAGASGPAAANGMRDRAPGRVRADVRVRRPVKR